MGYMIEVIVHRCLFSENLGLGTLGSGSNRRTIRFAYGLTYCLAYRLTYRAPDCLPVLKLRAN